MRAVLMVVANILREEAFQVALVNRDDVIPEISVRWLSLANQHSSGRFGCEEFQYGRMDTCGTRLRSRVVDSRFAYDYGCFASALPGDLSGSPTNFGRDGKNLLAAFG